MGIKNICNLSTTSKCHFSLNSFYQQNKHQLCYSQWKNPPFLNLNKAIIVFDLPQYNMKTEGSLLQSHCFLNIMWSLTNSRWKKNYLHMRKTQKQGNWEVQNKHDFPYIKVTARCSSIINVRYPQAQHSINIRGTLCYTAFLHQLENLIQTHTFCCLSQKANSLSC